METSCHCGAVRLIVPHRPQTLTSCNCSLCRRVGALWGYYERQEVAVDAPVGATVAYVQGDRTLEMHHCSTCGCVTHWQSRRGDDRMGVNFRLAANPEQIAGIPVRHLDGADTWKYLD